MSEVNENVNNLVEMVDKLTVAELAKVVEAIEEKYGVSAQMQPMMAAPAAGGDEGGQAKAEQTEFNVVLKDIGGTKIQVIKAVKEITGLGLKEAKEKVEGAPTAILEAVDKSKADEVAAKLKEAGATVEVE